MFSNIYNNLKVYINTQIGYIKEDLKQLFEDNKVKEVGSNLNTIKDVVNIKDDINITATYKDNINKVANIKDDIITLSNEFEKVDEVYNVYIGAFDKAPDTRRDGTDIQLGDMYVDTSAKQPFFCVGYDSNDKPIWQEAALKQWLGSDEDAVRSIQFYGNTITKSISIPEDTNALTPGSIEVKDDGYIEIPNNSTLTII